MVWKRSTNTTDAGDVVKFGTKDINKFSDYLDNVDVADPVTIATATTFNAGKLTASNIINGGTLTLPTGPETIVGRSTTDTLVNKTLTSPTINTPTTVTPTISDPSISGLINMAAGANFAINTTTGTKIGTSITQKIGFYNATPITQPVANADTSSATLPNLEIEVNQIKQLLRDLGLMAP